MSEPRVRVTICAVVEINGVMVSMTSLGETRFEDYDPAAMPALLRAIADQLERHG